MKRLDVVVLSALLLGAVPSSLAAETAGVPTLRSPKERADRSTAAQSSVQGSAGVTNPYKGGTRPRRSQPASTGSASRQE